MADLGIFVGAFAVACLVPESDMVLILQTAAIRGRTHALAVAFGLALARAAHVFLAAMGLAALLRAAPWAFESGAAYLGWLGNLRSLSLLPDGPAGSGLGVLPQIPPATATRRSSTTPASLRRTCLNYNCAERAPRGVALGKKSRLFAGSERGGLHDFLLVTAKLDGIDLQAWLADLLARMPNLPISRLPDLLPWDWRQHATPRKAVGWPGSPASELPPPFDIGGEYRKTY